MLPANSGDPNPGQERLRHELRASGVKDLAHNPLRSGVHTRGYLPHVKREGALYFVTFRLADAIPNAVVLKFERELAEGLRLLRLANDRGWPTTDTEESVKRELRRKIERYLDQGHGGCYLRRSDIGELTAQSILHFNGERYLLGEWVVMPNHVHGVVWPMPNHLLSDILKSWKQFISRRAKRLLGMGEEPFWQQESYDHWIRDDDEKARIFRYIRNNPVTARLCAKAEDWRWSGASPAFSQQQASLGLQRPTA
jgi:REP element-mobilizing transposase RayT